LQEQVNEKTVALSVRGAKLTGRLLAKAMQEISRQSRARSAAKRQRQQSVTKRGKQSLRDLKRDGAALENIEISGDNIGSFKKVARKYNVAFSLKRDNSETPPKWFVFFKAKDSQSLTKAFDEYSKIALREKKPKMTLRERIEKFRKRVMEQAAPVKNRERGGHEL